MSLNTVSIRTDQGNFNVRILGAQGSWLICWPSQLNDHTSLLDFAGLLSLHHRVVLIDPPAMGSNRHLPYSPHIADYMPFAMSVFRGLGITSCHWVGHGAGGVVGAALAVAKPERIISLTLASTPMINPGRFKRSAVALIELLSGFGMGRRLLIRCGMEQLGYADKQERAWIKRRLNDMLERTDPQTISSMRPLDGPSVRRIFDKLSLQPPPMLILCGKHDRSVLPRDQRTVAEITRAIFVELPCGHATLLAEQETCAHAVERLTRMQDKASAQANRLMAA
jgi:pimeloyl-ACP methyl ester carboxylesterase